jgi:O-antigen/teichoic acid export membrane protein
MAFIASLYPAMSYYWLNNKEQLAIAFRRSLDYLLLISVPISTAIFILSNEVVLIFKDSYAEAVWPLRISILALIFVFINFPIGSLLNACDKQVRNTRNMLLVLVFSVILNIILINKYQALGASIVVLLSNILMFVLGIVECRKIIDYKFRYNFINFLRIALASALMALFLLFLKSMINIFLLCLLAMLVYFSVLFIIGGFKKADLQYILNSFKKKK